MELTLSALARRLRDLAEAMDGVATGTDPMAWIPVIGIGLLVVAIFLFVGRLIRHGHSEREEGLRARVQKAELTLDAATSGHEAARKRLARLAAHGPETFIEALQGVDNPAAVARDWLEPLRPALAEAYGAMARETLLLARKVEDIARARSHALGALAADPENRSAAQLLAQIEEAARLRVFQTMSEADALTWKILRLYGTASVSAPGAAALLNRSAHRTGKALYLSGWEDQDLRAAALAHLTRNGQDRAALTAPARESAADVGPTSAEKGQAEKVPARKPGSGTEPRVGRGMRPVRAGARAEPDKGVADAVARGEVAAFRPREPEAAVARGLPFSLHLAAELATEFGTDADLAEASAQAGAGGGRRVVTMLARPGAAAVDPPAGAGPGGATAPPEAEAELRRLLERRSREGDLGPEHPRTLATRANLAHEIALQGRHAEAEAEFRAAWRQLSQTRVLGPTHRDTLTARHNLVVEIARQGRPAEAEAEFADLLETLLSRGGPGPDDPLTLATRHDLAAAIGAQGRNREAASAFRAVWEARGKTPGLGPDHPHTLWSRVQMLHRSDCAEAG